jgi:hypothetical protein
MGLEPGVMEDKTKPMENEKWISDDEKVGTRRGNNFGGSRDNILARSICCGLSK